MLARSGDFGSPGFTARCQSPPTTGPAAGTTLDVRGRPSADVEGAPHAHETTLVRSRGDSGDAAYEAHMTKANGTQVTVKFDKSFQVTAVEAGMGR